MSRILVVDDDRTTRELMRIQLKPAGHEIEEAENGEDALRKIQKGNFDLILLDVWMPGMDGLEVLARLRTQGPHPPVIVMTADDTSETVLRAIREQAYRFVTKPFAPRDVLDLVAGALESGNRARPIEVVSARSNWVELLVPCDLESAERIQGFLAKLDSDLPQEVRSKIGMAFRELLFNAVEWGGKLDPNQRVRISYVRGRRVLLYRIADPGRGFKFKDLDHAAITYPEDDPFTHTEVREQKGLRPGGLGLLMTKAMVDDLIYNEAHNEVMFIKYLD